MLSVKQAKQTRNSRKARNPRLVLIDSGAVVHVCGKDDFPNAQIRPDPQPMLLRGAGGHELEHLGWKTVNVQCQGQMLTIEFAVIPEVHMPILSVSVLVKRGYSVILDAKRSYIEDKQFDRRLDVTVCTC